jgi:hypothetical protein
MKLPKINNTYELNYRIKSNIGIWGNWIKGTGEFKGIELVQDQIKTIRKSHVNKVIEIEFRYEDELKGYSGEITGKTIIYETR